ncbi:MAG: hypothetical protein B6242_16695, partial [Anaerolineaceae bacterium 4572_78]
MKRKRLFLLFSMLMLLGMLLVLPSSQSQLVAQGPLTEESVIFTFQKGDNDGELGISDPAPEMHPTGPQALTVDENGTIYVLDSLNRRVFEFNQTTQSLNKIDVPQSASLADIVVQNDQLYLMDAGLEKVLQVNKSGETVETYPITSDMRHGSTGISVLRNGDVRWQTWRSKEYSLLSQSTLDNMGYQKQVQQEKEKISIASASMDSVWTTFVRIDDHEGALQIWNENDKLIQVLRLRVQHYLGSMVLQQIDEQGNYYVLTEELLKDVPTFIVDTTIRRFDSSGDLIDTASVPINDIYYLPHRFTAVNNTGDAYFLRVYEGSSDVVQLPFKSEHHANLEERWAIVEQQLASESLMKETEVNAKCYSLDQTNKIRRDEVIQNAQSFLNYTWTLIDSNYRPAKSEVCIVDGTANWRRPINLTADQMVECGYCTTPNLANSKYFEAINWNDLKRGDILNWYKGHVILFDSFDGNQNSVIGYESTADNGGWTGYLPRTFSNLNTSQGTNHTHIYVARRPFHIEESNEPPSQPVPITPRDNQWSSLNQVILRWRASTDSDGPNSLTYSLSINNINGNAGDLPEHDVGQNTEYPFTAPEDGAYTWQVWASDGENTSAVSPKRTFIIGDRSDAPFRDIPPGHVFEEEISCLKDNFITQGFSDGLFHPERLITRGEAAVMITRWQKRYLPSMWEVSLPHTGGWSEQTFKDVSLSSDSEVARAVEFLHSNDGGNISIVKGYIESTGYRVFKPNQSLTRSEAVKMIVRILKDKQNRLANLDVSAYAFEDTNDEEILLGRERGITNGYSDGTFRPANQITRGEFAAFLGRAMAKLKDGSCHASTSSVALKPTLLNNTNDLLCFSAIEGAPIPNINITQAGTTVCYKFSDASFFMIDDVPHDDWAKAYIQNMYDAGITRGCNDTGTSYCPDNTIQRDHMVIFLLRAKYYKETGDSGLNYTPPTATRQIYADVSLSHPYVDWINEASNLGITQVREGDNFEPGEPTTRLQATLFLLRTLIGQNVLDTLPYPLGIFEDVPIANLNASDLKKAAAYEELYWRGLTFGCDSDEFKFCPDDPLERKQAAAFISRGFLDPTTPTNRMGDFCFSTEGGYDIPRVGFEKPGLPDVQDTDIVCYHEQANLFKMYFNGSVNGIDSEDIDAFSIPVDGQIWFSTNDDPTIPGLGDFEDEDIIIFENGQYSLGFVGASSEPLDGENIDGFHHISDNDVYLSITTSADFCFDERGENDDIVNWIPNSQTFHQFFDGSDMYVDAGVNGVSVLSTSSQDSTIYMTFENSFCVPSKIGTCGDGGDIVRYDGTTGSETLGSFSVDLCFESSSHNGLENETLDAIHIPYELDCEPIIEELPPLGTLEIDKSTLNFNDTTTSESVSVDTEAWWLLNWTARTDADWLTLSEDFGTAPSTLDVSVDSTDLSQGTYTGTIFIESADADNNLVEVDVTFKVGEVEALSEFSITLSDDSGSAATSFNTGDEITMVINVTNNLDASIDTIWNWIVTNSQEQVIDELSRLNVSKTIDTGWKGFIIDKTIPDSLPSGDYTYTGRVQLADGTQILEDSIDFTVSSVSSIVEVTNVNISGETTG